MPVLFLVLAAGLAGQELDSSLKVPPHPDRIVIDVATIAREGPARTISEVLITRVPGILVVPGSGLNASGTSIRLAGVRSLVADEPPLFLVDGFRIDTREDDSQMGLGGPGPSRLDDIALEDVETIEVLRGPAGTAAYGPGASTGVILIRTKTGRSGSLRMEGVVQGAVHSVPTRWPTNYGGVDLDNASAYFQNGGCSLSLQATGSCVQDFVQTFNPLAQRNPFGSAPDRQVGLSATAGPAWGAFRISGMVDGDAAAYSVPAITWADDSRRWNLRASATVRPVRNVNVSATVARMSSSVRLPMYSPVRNALMGTSDSSGFTWAPYFQDHATQEFDRTQLGITAEARPLAWLTLQAGLGRDDDQYHEKRTVPAPSLLTGVRTGANHTYRFNATASDLAWRRLRFTTTLGVERLTNRDEARLDLISPGSSSWQRLVRRVDSWGFYGVERIAIDGRWFITGTLRHDSFDDIHAWSATYPSVAVDWVARPDRQGALGSLILRAGYGAADQSPPYAVETLMGAFGQGGYGYGLGFAYAKPERTGEFAVSALASGLGGRWHAQVAAYDARSNVLAYRPVPGSYGAVPAYVPGAELSNRGITAILSANLIDRTMWGWNLQLSVWGNRNRVVKQPTSPILYGDGQHFAQGDFQGYPANGYWSRPVSFSDANGDGIIGSNEIVIGNSLTWAGQPYPTQGAALISTLRFTRWLRLSVMLDYRAGQTLFNETSNIRCVIARCRELFDRTTPLGSQANALAAGQLPASYFEDADYLKLREVTFAFDLPRAVVSALGARAATIVVGGRNLQTWTRYSGSDPEAGSYGRRVNGSPTIVGDYATVPVPASWMLRVRMAY
jgi:TonB-dependent starch-binding outer membrane protein SusC